jgi:ElaB/YqjD/DUF883 family membrane-anchored ribosome-binding protein
MAEIPENTAANASLNSSVGGSGRSSASTGGTAGAGLGSSGTSGSSASLGSGSTTPLDTAGPAVNGAGAAGTSTESAQNRRAEARSRFNSALEEARAGLEALRADAAERGASYRSKATSNTADWVEEMKSLGEGARKRAGDAAVQGKTRASDGLQALGRAVSDTATVIDERLGAKYGDYARSAARTMQETAARLEAKEIGEIGDDVRTFVRSSPGTAIGIAAVAGFFIARLFGAGSSKE